MITTESQCISLLQKRRDYPASFRQKPLLAVSCIVAYVSPTLCSMVFFPSVAYSLVIINFSFLSGSDSFIG